MVKQKIRYLVFILAMIAGATPVSAQKKKQSSNQVTPKNAMQKERKNLEEKQAQYQQSKNHHQEAQDKQTRKRMKRNLKKARKHSWGKDVPWYKRWFRKSKV